MKSRTYRGIQALRAIAALMVVAHHCMVLLQQRLNITFLRPFNGAQGVDIFFVISGFVMMTSSQSLKASVFIKRRLERIVPLYWLATTIKIALLLLLPEIAINPLGSGWNIAGSYLFIQSVPVLNVGWTLNYEMLFYVLFAVCLATRWKIIPTLSLALCVISFLPLGYEPIMLEFLGGIVLATLKPSKPWLSLCLLAGGTAALLLNPTGDQTFNRVLTWGLPALAIVVAIVWLEGKWKVPDWFVLLGDSSYAIYLFHAFVLPPLAIALLHLHLGKISLIISTICMGIATSAAFGVLAHQFVERPIMNYFRSRR